MSGTRATLKYLVKGLNPSREHQADLQRELSDNLAHANSVIALPVVDGFSVEIEVADIAPFNTSSFEPYIAEHVLPDAVKIRCRPAHDPDIQLIKARFD